MPQLSPDEQRALKDLAERHRVSVDAVVTLLAALQAGGGRQAQFNHPELGGMGQWSFGGMIMIGDMFNSGLKARVGSLCGELSAWLGRKQDQPAAPTQPQTQSQDHTVISFLAAGHEPAWWPSALGTPALSGAQNDLRYAYFPRAQCLAINHQGRITLYGTGAHQISGVSQQHGGGQSVTFTSQHGVVRLADLPLLKAEAADQGLNVPGSACRRLQDDPTGSAGLDRRACKQDYVGIPSDHVFASIERLAELHRKGVLTEEEFTTKKAELLSRL